SVVRKPIADALSYQGGRRSPSFGQYQCEFIPTEARRGIHVAAADTQNIGQPAKGLAANQVPEAVVDSLHPVQIKKQESEFASCALGTLDFRVHRLDQLAVVGKTGERIFGGLLTEMIFEFALLGDVLDDDLVALFLSLLGDRASTEAKFEKSAVLPVPFDFERSRMILLVRVTQQLDSFGGIREDLRRQVRGQ